MNVAIIYGGIFLAFRKTLDVVDCDPWDDPRGLSGSELYVLRMAEEIAELGHDVTLFTEARKYGTWGKVDVEPIGDARTADVAIAVNDPGPLTKFRNGVFRVFVQHVNSFEYCKRDFDKFVELFVSPSEPHRRMILGKSHDVEMQADLALGQYHPDPGSWTTIELGCDPGIYSSDGKARGRVVYTSSPDRGLHWLLQEWPRIKRDAPHASLKIFYRLKEWLDSWDQTPFYPPVERLRDRAMYIREALRRMRDGYDIEVCDAVSRRQLASELSKAEVLAYPCDTIRWSEGFSCSVLEACAAGAVPVITDCDALGEVYRGAAAITPVDYHGIAFAGRWSSNVSLILNDDERRRAMADDARRFARQRTWRHCANQLIGKIEEL